MLQLRRAQIVAASACLLAATGAGAQSVCLAPPVENWTPPGISTDDGLVFLASEGSVDADGSLLLTGGIEFIYQDRRVSAERLSRSTDDASLEVLGDVTLEGEDFSVFAGDARFDRASEEMRFSEARLSLTVTELTARAAAEEIVVSPESRNFFLRNLSFTTCPEDDVDWELRARTLEIDEATGIGTLRGATLRFLGVPVLKTPYFSFPIDDRRKSGFLTPKIAERDRTGFDLTVPYYLDLAPNYDLLLEPRYMSDRGVQIGSRYRYLLPQSEGELSVEYLPDDRSLDRSRLFVDYTHETLFGDDWRLITDIENVSDSAYFEDLGDSLGTISQTHLDRFVDLAYYGSRWSLVTRVKEYQTIDDQIDEIDRPYERLPQMQFAGHWGDRVPRFESTAEAVRFDRSIGATGWRLDTSQEVSLRFDRPGYYVIPAVGFRQTSYHIDRTSTTPRRTPSRGLSITSLDTGLRFERSAGRESSWTQTIEPRMLYVKIPYEDQSELPVFDTILPDFNLVQLFNKYQFVGPDRIADTNRLSIGMTTRLLASATGRERVSATVGQTRFREPRRVMLPDESAIDSTRSNYVAELAINLSARWNLDVGYQWNGETEETVRTRTQFEYRPEDDRLFGIGYRMRKGLLEQGDLSMIWPVGGRWRVIGQYSYSLLENKALERFAGMEYESCCWRVRLTSRHYIVRSTGQTDSTISIELELKGLGNNGASPEELLGRGILNARRSEQF